MTFGEISLVFYFVFVVLVVLRLRQIGVKLFDLSVFAVNTGVICWLLFLFRFLSPDEYAAHGLRVSNDSWIPWCCLLLSVLLIPVTVLGVVRGARSRHNNDVTPDERMAALQSARRRYPRAIVTLIIGAPWLIFIGGKTFGYLHSHFLLIALGIGTSAVLGWIVLVLIKQWHRQNGAAP